MTSRKLSSNFNRLWLASTCQRNYSTFRPLPSDIYQDVSKSSDPAVCSTPTNLTPAQRDALDSALRVDQAGEIAANYIYMGQMAVLGRDPHLRLMIQVSSNQYMPLADGRIDS